MDHSVDNEDQIDPTKAMLDALDDLTVDNVPTLEYLFIGHLVEAIEQLHHDGSPTDDAAYEIMGHLQGAMMACGDPDARPPNLPIATDDIIAYREALVAGAHSFAEHGADGFQMLVAMLVPAVIGELDNAGDDLDAKLQGVYQWILMGIVAGYGAQEPPMWAWVAIRESLALWSEIMVPES